jgi:ankyrin repeat protein
MNNFKLLNDIEHAIENGDAKLVVSLIGHDHDVLNAITLFGSWLHIAAQHGQLPIAKWLADAGLDLDLPGGILGGSAINTASSEGHINIVEFLLSRGAKLDISDPERNPLFAAIYGGHIEIVKLLLDHGLDPHVTYDSPLRGGRMDAISFARERGQTGIANYLAKRTQATQL